MIDEYTIKSLIINNYFYFLGKKVYFESVKGWLSLQNDQKQDREYPPIRLRAGIILVKSRAL